MIGLIFIIAKEAIESAAAELVLKGIKKFWNRVTGLFKKRKIN